MFVPNPNIFRQSRAFYLITSLELWQRFSYYGLQGILPLYLVQQIGLSETAAFTLFGLYCGLSFGFIAMGNWLGKHIIDSKSILMMGASVLLFGHTLLALSHNQFNFIYLGLAAISVGHGLFKTTPEQLLPEGYSQTRFTLYHMLACVGSFTALFVMPIVAEYVSWNIAFAVSVFGIFMIILCLIFYAHWGDGFGPSEKFPPIHLKKIATMMLLIAGLIGFSFALLCYQQLAYGIIALVTLIALLLFIKELHTQQGPTAKKMIVAFLLLLEMFIFFMLYIQIPTSINFFTLHHVTPNLFGIAFLPMQFQALSPFWILLTAPVIATLYDRVGSQLPIAHKLAIGMVLCAGAFLVLPWGAVFADEDGMLAAHWLVLHYALHSIGHLTISALGLIIVIKMVPANLKALIIVLWYLTITLASLTAGYIAGFTVTDKTIGDPLPSLAVYSEIFMRLGIFTACIAMLMIISAPLIHRMMQD